MRFIWLSTLVLSSLQAQLPDRESLIKQSAEALKKFHSLQFDSETTIETSAAGGSPIKLTTQASWAYVNPDKRRTESSAQGTSSIMVSDGEYTWMYFSHNKQYIKIPAALGPAGLIEGVGMKMPDMASVHSSIKTLREETIEVDGQKHDCWVVETQIGEMAVPIPQTAKEARMTGAAMTAWIDKKLFIDLRSTMSSKMQMAGMPAIEIHQKTVKKNLKIDQPIADSLFTFSPPPDAKEVKELALFAGAPKVDLTSKDAPAFEVKGLDEKAYSLAALKGKPVLLDFWATWCAPCRRSLPVLDKIYQEYQNQGLVILGVDAGEEREIVEQFLKKTPQSYPAVLTGESEILGAYEVTAYPTFVLIGRDGKIVADEVGFGGEEALRAMIAKAGLTAPGQP